MAGRDVCRIGAQYGLKIGSRYNSPPCKQRKTRHKTGGEMNEKMEGELAGGGERLERTGLWC